MKSLSFGHLDCCARWGNVSLLLPASGSTAETLFTTDIFRTEKLKARGKLEQHGLHVLLVYFYIFCLQHFNHRLEQQIQWCPARHRIWQRGNRSAWRKESGDREKSGIQMDWQGWNDKIVYMACRPESPSVLQDFPLKLAKTCNETFGPLIMHNTCSMLQAYLLSLFLRILNTASPVGKTRSKVASGTESLCMSPAEIHPLQETQCSLADPRSHASYRDICFRFEDRAKSRNRRFNHTSYL